MQPTVNDILNTYDASAPLNQAYTIPAAWYVDPRIDALERSNVFGRNWQAIGRLDQVAKPGDFFTATLAGEPIVVARGNDNQLRAFYNVCRHHAAAVVTEAQGHAAQFRCPYHGWTYGLEGALKGTPEFDGVCQFDRAQNGLVPITLSTWEQFVFVNLDPQAPPLEKHLGSMIEQVKAAEIRLAEFLRAAQLRTELQLEGVRR
jgi:choline monooxygenase